MPRFSPRFLNVFFRLPPAPSFFSGVAPSAVGSALAINHQSAITSHQCSDGLLLRDGALARSLARPRVGLRPLPANRQAAPVAHPAVAADFHQPLDVHRDLLAEIALDATL